MSTFLGQLFWVLFWANQLQEILFLILWKNNFFWSKLFEQLFWVILLLKVLFWVNILFKVIFWGLFWVGLLFWGLFWVTFLLQTLFWVNLLKKLLKKVLKKVLKERSPQKSTQKSPFILLFWIQNLYQSQGWIKISINEPSPVLIRLSLIFSCPVTEGECSSFDARIKAWNNNGDHISNIMFMFLGLLHPFRLPQY